MTTSAPNATPPAPTNGAFLSSSHRGESSVAAKLKTLARDIKLSHTLFALPFALLCAFLAANGWPGTGDLTVCHCESCQKVYREKVGAVPPDTTDATSPFYRKYYAVYMDRVMEVWALWDGIAREKKADSVYENLPWPALSAGDIADCILFALSRPLHVNVDEIVIMALAQSSGARVFRNP